jgi:hypothetical protein
MRQFDAHVGFDAPGARTHKHHPAILKRLLEAMLSFGKSGSLRP